MKRVEAHSFQTTYEQSHYEAWLTDYLTLDRDTFLTITLTRPSAAVTWTTILVTDGSITNNMIRNPSGAARLYNIAVDYAMTGYRALQTPTQPVELTLEGTHYVCQPQPPSESEYPSPMKWIEAFSVAIALRRKDGIAVLGTFPPRLFDTGYDAVWVPLCEAYQKFVLGDPGWAALASTAESLAPQATKDGPKVVARCMSMIPVLRAIAASDQSAFTDALVAALKAHKAEASRGKLKDTMGTFSDVASALAALGVDRGLRLEVESGYMPSWLVLAESAGAARGETR